MLKSLRSIVRRLISRNLTTEQQTSVSQYYTTPLADVRCGTVVDFDPNDGYPGKWQCIEFTTVDGGLSTFMSFTSADYDTQQEAYFKAPHISVRHKNKKCRVLGRVVGRRPNEIFEPTRDTAKPYFVEPGRHKTVTKLFYGANWLL